MTFDPLPRGLRPPRRRPATRIRATAFAIVAIVAGALAAPAAAQAPAYPGGQPVKLVVGFPPGAAADVAARVLATQLARTLGTSIVVENRAGAASNIATEVVARAPADGYTLLFGSVANAINQTLFPDLKFDFTKDFAPIALVGTVPNVLVVHPSVPADSVKALIATAKAKSEPLAFGSSGTGTSPHLSGELFAEMAGVKLLHVPYKGSSQAVVDLLAGRVALMFSPASTVLPHIKAGKLRALASTGAARASAAPELPTLAESGLAGFDTGVWVGVLAPSGTPAAIVERLVAATRQARDSSEVRSQLQASGIDPLGGGPEEFRAYIASEVTKWAKVIRTAGVKPE
jgi:tripartite-type tricarboxylate transporter receptor subunit TctC